MKIRNSYLTSKAFNSFLLASMSTMAAIQIGDTVDGSPRHVTVAVLLSAISNIVFDFLFIVVMGWGVLGAAWATLLSYLVLLGVLIPHFFRKDALCLAALGQSGIVALSVCLYMQCISDIIINGAMKAFQPVASILKGAGDNQGVGLVVRKLYRFLIVTLCMLAIPMLF